MVVDDTWSTWDHSRDFAPEEERNEREEEKEKKIDEVEEKWEVGEMASQREDTCSNCKLSNVRLMPVITPGSWEKGELLGSGSFGFVYEGISQ